MNTLTVKQKPADKPVGLFRIYCGRKPVAALVLPTFQVELGMKPSDNQVRSAVQECSPALSVNEQTIVKWETR